MPWLDRTPLARVLIAYLVTTAVRSVAVVLVTLAAVVAGLVLVAGPDALASVVDWRPLVRVLLVVGRIVLGAPTHPLQT